MKPVHCNLHARNILRVSLIVKVSCFLSKKCKIKIKVQNGKSLRLEIDLSQHLLSPISSLCYCKRRNELNGKKKTRQRSWDLSEKNRTSTSNSPVNKASKGDRSFLFASVFPVSVHMVLQCTTKKERKNFARDRFIIFSSVSLRQLVVKNEGVSLLLHFP